MAVDWYDSVNRKLIPCKSWNLLPDGRVEISYKTDILADEDTMVIVPRSSILVNKYDETGQSPVPYNTGAISAFMEQRLSEEATLPTSKLIVFADNIAQGPLKAISAFFRGNHEVNYRYKVPTSRIGVLSGGRQIRGDRANQKADAIRVAIDPSEQQLALRNQCRIDILSSLGLTDAVVSGDRDAVRIWSINIVIPVIKRIEKEIQGIISDFSIDYSPVKEPDLQSRARSMGSLVQSGMKPEYAAYLSGFGGLITEVDEEQLNALKEAMNEGEANGRNRNDERA